MHQRIKYDVLSQKELEYMKDRLEQILIERGVHLDHEEMLKALEEKGCIVDMEARDVRFTKELFTGSMDKVGAVLKAFYDNGGVQTNLCVIGRDDLENAMAHPENYQNLLVRIGGFSARFVTLNPVVQREIIDRTTYGA